MKKRLAFLLCFSVVMVLHAQTDTIPPTIICKQQPLIVFLQPTGLISFWADSSLYDTLYDNESTHLELGIRKVCTGTGFPDDTLVTYYCLGAYAAEMWARDEAGNSASCITRIIIGDLGFSEPCTVYATAITPEGDGVEEALLQIEGYHCYYDSFTYQGSTGLNWGGSGLWSPEPGANFTLTPSKNDNPLNGVTTYDLLLISKHILGIQPLDSPYKLIAADANQDGKITTFDIVLLRQLILGMTSQLPHGLSWRFIPKDYEFPDPANPFDPGFPEKIVVPFVTDPPQSYFEFVGVKIGDVDY